MSSREAVRRSVVFGTHAFDDASTGPAVFARYLWERFADSESVNFHMVAPEGPSSHPRFHKFGQVGSSATKFYFALIRKTISVAAALPPPVIVHLNASHYPPARLPSDTRLWLQLNDTEATTLFRQPLAALRVHGIRRFRSLVFRRVLEQYAVARCDLALANSHFTASTVRLAYPQVPASRVITLYKGVDLSFFAELTRPEAPISQRRFVFIGRNFVRKRLDLVVEAFAKLPPKSAVLRVAGCTLGEFVSAFPGLTEVAHAPGLTFLGKLGRSAIRDLLLESDTLLLPSREEALGVVALEALASGCRVIGSRVGGIPEIVSSPNLGVLLEPSQLNASTLFAALEVETRTPRLAAFDRAASVRRFSTVCMLNRIERLYSSL